MRKILLFLSFGLGGLFLMISTFVLQKELKKLAKLRSQTPIDVEIIEVNCKRKSDEITFKWKGKEHFKYIEIKSEACKKLQKQRYIQIKVGPKGKIIFAKEAYNGSLDTELYLKIIFGFLIGMALIYYLVYPRQDY